MSKLQNISFQNHTLITALYDDKPYVAMRPICEAIGLAWNGQYERIKRDEVLSSSVRVIRTVAEDGRKREMSFLPIEYLNGWLFGIDANRVKPEIKEKLIQYKRECYQALNDYWNKGAAVNPRKTLTPEMQRHIQELVTGIKLRKGIHWSTTYSKIKTVFQVGSYKDIRIEDYPALCDFLGGEPLEGEWLGKAPTTNDGTVRVSKTNLNALVVNALGACELMKSIYPAMRTLNSPMAPNLYSRTEELHLCALLMKRESDKEARGLALY